MGKNTPVHDSASGSYRSYISGFLFSIILTFEAYFIVSRHSMAGNKLIFTISGLAIIQLLVQLIFFLHLGRESKPRWNLTALMFAMIVVVILVAGSLWIMYHLNYNMTPQQTNTYIQNEENIHKL